MTAEMEKSPSSTSLKRPLRRSRTITCNVYPATRPLQENAAYEKTDEASPDDSKTSPKSSCQALRHAVSALTRLDDFICEKIGAGFFSEVFKVTHRITGQVMALKMNTMSSNRHNMLREVQLLNRLTHPNILRFMGVCVHEGQLHALTEFIWGGSLEQLLASKEEELPWTQRIQLTLDLSKGLNYLHSRGFMHRDLTSKNILMKKENNGYHAVLADFGLATKIPDPLSQEKLQTVGSPYWVGPEVLNGQFYNERADLFSVGIIMCEITARIPADPDIMPRTNNFGVDYVALSEMIAYCPLDYLQLAFKCCQVNPMKRPEGCEIIEWLEKIFKNLQNDIFTRQQKEKSERSGHKRSRSEDNILKANDSEADTSSEDIVITPVLIGQVMSRDDPAYVPSSTNPFASIQRFQHGRKLLGTSIDYAAELPSPSSLLTPPSTPGNRAGRDGLDGPETRKCQSLPSSPVLLRRAAEKLHQESLHGSARYCHQHHQSQTVRAVRSRSKSTIFSDAFAHRLQTELSLSLQPDPESWASSNVPKSSVKRESWASSDVPESSVERESCRLCEASTSSGNNVEKTPPPGGSVGSQINGSGKGNRFNSSPQAFAPSTATRRRMLRKLKYQSLDGDVVGVPPIKPLCSVTTTQVDAANDRKLPVDATSGRKSPSFTDSDESADKESAVKCNSRESAVKCNSRESAVKCNSRESDGNSSAVKCNSRESDGNSSAVKCNSRESAGKCNSSTSSLHRDTKGHFGASNKGEKSKRGDTSVASNRGEQSVCGGHRGGQRDRQGDSPLSREDQGAETINNNIRKGEHSVYVRHETTPPPAQSSCQSCTLASRQHTPAPSSLYSHKEVTD